MISGIIEDWGIDFMSEYYNKCISGEIYDSSQFGDTKHIYTSNIENISLEYNYLHKELGVKPLINIKTINSKYILGKISNDFKEYLKILVECNKLCKNTYSLDSDEGIINIIKWHLENNNK
tara:strand:- start:879 stop:1241 length:363 start_codon:yes stop_codon:yes gene_type:complete